MFKKNIDKHSKRCKHWCLPANLGSFSQWICHLAGSRFQISVDGKPMLNTNPCRSGEGHCQRIPDVNPEPHRWPIYFARAALSGSRNTLYPAVSSTFAGKPSSITTFFTWNKFTREQQFAHVCRLFKFNPQRKTSFGELCMRCTSLSQV